MKAGWMAAVGSALLLAFGLDLVSARRQLIAGRRTVDHAFARAELALAQRAEAMAGLAGAVARNPGLEGTPLDAMLASRASAIGARTRSEKIAADERVERALARLVLFEEAHSDLHLSEKFGDVERDVAVARANYNDAVLRYNASLTSFPRNIAARIFGFRQENDYFKPDAGSESSK
jgi:LemA protein